MAYPAKRFIVEGKDRTKLRYPGESQIWGKRDDELYDQRMCTCCDYTKTTRECRESSLWAQRTMAFGGILRA